MKYPHKLIRDKIPDIASDPLPLLPVDKLTTQDQLALLCDKAHEEVEEVLAEIYRGDTDALEEELADVFEVLAAIIKIGKVSETGIEDKRKYKREIRGGFDTPVLLNLKEE